jgi:ABC-type lipoprotein release transport system permease subunit
MASQLYDVEPTDPLTFALVAVTLGGAALVASLLPSLRATRVDPMAALRYE